MIVTNIMLDNKINFGDFLKVVEISSEKIDFSYHLYQEKDSENLWHLECNNLDIQRCLETEDFNEAIKKANFYIQTKLSNELANKILRFETLGNEFLLLENSLEEEKEINKESEMDILL